MIFAKKPEIRKLVVVSENTFNVFCVEKEAKKRVGITFGAFDPLHYGHIKLFENAKKHCDVLIVCVSDDEYIKGNKGHKERVSFRERKEAVKAIKYVDEVDIQSLHYGKKEACQNWKPDVIFVGSDWNQNTFKGMNLGVPVVFLPHTKGISSTLLVNKK
jgi:glycerol-3-phosphate cytidylyltransferase